MLEITRILCNTFEENAYLICPEAAADCYLVDPGDGLPALRRAIAQSGRRLAAIYLTHAHFDHTLAAQPLSAEFGAPVYCHPMDAPLLEDPRKNGLFMTEGADEASGPKGMATLAYPDSLRLGGAAFSVLHTPGHTPGGVCLYCEAERTLFSGDTLFCQGFGRMDLFGGSPRDMRASLRTLLALPGDTRLYPGHGPEGTLAQVRGGFGK